MPIIGTDGLEYDEIPKEALQLSAMLTNAYIAVGRPEDPLSTNGRKLIKIVLAAWEDLYPHDVVEWKAARDEHLSAEMSISEQVSKRTGRTLGSYPAPVYFILCKLFPKFKFTERENMIKIVREFPIFRFVNKI